MPVNFTDLMMSGNFSDRFTKKTTIQTGPKSIEPHDFALRLCSLFGKKRTIPKLQREAATATPSNPNLTVQIGQVGIYSNESLTLSQPIP